MCFSAEADLVAGLAVSAIGVASVHRVRVRSDRALAALPLVLGLHLLVETVVWLGLEGRVAAHVWRPAMWVYLLIAFGILPILVPVAVASAGPADVRKRLAPFVALGVAVAAVLVAALVSGPIGARIDGRHIAYDVSIGHGGMAVGAYLVATCVSVLMSPERTVRLFGWANLAAVGMLLLVQRNGLTSLWCAWAAVTSVAIAVRTGGGDPADHPVAERVRQLVAR